VKLKNICNLIDYLKIKKWWGEIEKKKYNVKKWWGEIEKKYIML